MLSACHTSRLSQSADSSQTEIAANENNLNTLMPASYSTEEPALALASVEEQPAAASTRPAEPGCVVRAAAGGR